MERDVDSLVKRKCQPVGTSLMPRNWAVVVKERRSMPQRIPAGRSRRRMVGVKAMAMVNAKGWKVQLSFVVSKSGHIMDGQMNEQRPAWRSGTGE